jgi:hypothetical protein
VAPSIIAPVVGPAGRSEAPLGAGPDALPDPLDDADALEELGDEIATLAAHIHAATHRLLVLIADFDERRSWELDGHRGCAHWLAFRTGIDLGAAREKVRTARALVGLPDTSASMARGELSFSQVRALSRVARPDNERELLELARGCTTAQLERMVRGWKRTNSRKDEVALERERQESRTFSVFPDLDGMYVVRGKLPPEVGLLLMRAIEAASDQIYREQPVEALETDKAAAHRRADALALLAERAMAAGFGGGGACGEGEGDEAGPEAGPEAPVSGTRAERYQVVLHVDEATLSANGRPAACGDGCPGRSELDDGTRVSAETSRRVSCDAGLVRMRHGPDGQILDVGRRTRTIPPALRRALEARDRGCRFPTTRLRRAVPAGSASRMATTSATGPTGARRASRTRCSSVATIMRWCTRAAGGSSGGARGGRRSSDRGVRCCSRGGGSRPSCRTRPSKRSSRSSEHGASTPTSAPLAPAGSARRTSRPRSGSRPPRLCCEGGVAIDLTPSGRRSK